MQHQGVSTDPAAQAPLQQSGTQVLAENADNGNIQKNESAAVIDAFKVVTWNTEHFAYPRSAGCKPRTSEDIAAIKAYIAGLDASVIALQEVASKEALRLVFPERDWALVLSARADSPAYECRENGFTSTQQKVAFAIKKDIPILDVKQNAQLGLQKTGLRFGLAVTVETPLGPTDILNVHLKSGCFVDDYATSEKAACQTLAQQVPVLEEWLATHQKLTMPYMVLGDFNHRLASDNNYLASRLTSDEYGIDIATQALRGCHPRYPEPIDHILLGGMQSALIASSAHVYKYENMHEDAMLSDHCAVSVVLM
jgi:endonuclease/exonuclease/phosphatase family metal-dependent hydrolase